MRFRTTALAALVLLVAGLDEPPHAAVVNSAAPSATAATDRTNEGRRRREEVDCTDIVGLLWPTGIQAVCPVARLPESLAAM